MIISRKGKHDTNEERGAFLQSKYNELSLMSENIDDVKLEGNFVICFDINVRNYTDYIYSPNVMVSESQEALKINEINNRIYGLYIYNNSIYYGEHDNLNSVKFNTEISYNSDQSAQNGFLALGNSRYYRQNFSGNRTSVTLSTRNWHSVASSADGTKLVACAYNNYIYTSTDSGVTWTVRANTGGQVAARNWRSVASSADGTKLVACAISEYIYTSTNSGATWTTRTNIGVQNWQFVSYRENLNYILCISTTEVLLCTFDGNIVSSIIGSNYITGHIFDTKLYEDNMKLIEINNIPAILISNKESLSYFTNNNTIILRNKTLLSNQISNGNIIEKNGNPFVVLVEDCNNNQPGYVRSMYYDGVNWFNSLIKSINGPLAFTSIKITELKNGHVGIVYSYIKNNLVNIEYSVFDGSLWSTPSVVATNIENYKVDTDITYYYDNPYIVYSILDKLYCSWTEDGGISWDSRLILDKDIILKTKVVNIKNNVFILVGDVNSKCEILKKEINTNNYITNGLIKFQSDFNDFDIINSKLCGSLEGSTNYVYIDNSPPFRTVQNLQDITENTLINISNDIMIAYGGNNKLTVGYYNGNSWSFEDLIQSASYSINISILFGKPRLTYVNNTGFLMYSEYDFNNSSWLTPSPIRQLTTSSKFSLSDAVGNVAVYYTVGSELRMSRYDGSNWSEEPVFTADNNSYISSKNVVGLPSVIFTNSGKLHFARKLGNWQTIQINNDSDVSRVSLFNKKDFYPNVCYLTGTINRTLRYQSFNGVSWDEPETIDNEVSDSLISLKLINDITHIFYTKIESINGISQSRSYVAKYEDKWIRYIYSDNTTDLIAVSNDQNNIDALIISPASVGNDKLMSYFRKNAILNSSFETIYDTNSFGASILNPDNLVLKNSNGLFFKSKINNEWNETLIDSSNKPLCDSKEINGYYCIAYDKDTDKVNFTKEQDGVWLVTPKVVFQSLNLNPRSVSLCSVNSQPAISFITENSILYTRSTNNGDSWPTPVNLILSEIPKPSLYSKLKMIENNNEQEVFYINESNKLTCIFNNTHTVIVDVKVFGFDVADIDGNTCIIAKRNNTFIFSQRVNGVWENENTLILSTSDDFKLISYNNRPVILENNHLYVRNNKSSWVTYSLTTHNEIIDAMTIDLENIIFISNGETNTKIGSVNVKRTDGYSHLFSTGDSYESYLSNGIDTTVNFKIKQSNEVEKNITYRLDNRDFNNYVVIGNDSKLSLFVNGGLSSEVDYDNTIKSTSSWLKIGGEKLTNEFVIDDFSIRKNVDFNNVTEERFVEYISQNPRYEDLRAHWEPNEYVEEDNDKGVDCSLCSVNDLPAVSYQALGATTYLKYAEKNNGVWASYEIDNPGGQVGGFTSLIEFDEAPWIAYWSIWEPTSHFSSLKCARYDKTSSEWIINFVDKGHSTKFVGSHCSMAVIGLYPAISYYNLTNSSLQYVSWNGSSWDSPQIIDAVQNSGLYSSLCQIGGVPCVAYYKAGEKALYFVQYDNNSWATSTKEKVDEGGIFGVGHYASLGKVIDSGEKAVIAYYDQTNKRLKYAKRISQNNWEVQVVDSGYVGEYSSLVVIDNLPIITYYNQWSKEINYIRYDGTRWIKEYFHGFKGSGYFSSVADINGRPHICYYNINNRKLGYLAPTKHIFKF